MSKLLRRLLASLFPAVVDDDDLQTPPDDDQGDDDQGDDDQGDDDQGDDDQGDDDQGDDTPPARQTRRAARDEGNSQVVRDALERARRLEDDVEILKRSSAAPSEDQRLRLDEDRQLADPQTDPMVKWQIQANRTLRDTQQNASRALAEARDMQDRAAFMSKASTDPRRAKYEDRIEKELKTLRNKGQNVDRETLYYYQLGKDIAEGKLKAAPKKTSAAASVPRGRTPAARSDVRARGGSRSSSGARERLADKPI
jgi:hypothetical protein